MKKICHISTVHNKSDDRIFYKECISLANSGFDVSLIVQSQNNEEVDGVKIIALPSYKSRLTRMIFAPLIAFFKALNSKAKVIHFHDPELIFVGLLLKLFGKKIIYDMHELVYCQINDKEWISNNMLKKIVLFSYKIIEKLSVQLFDKIVLAEDGYSKYFDENYKKQLYKVVFIRNFPVLELINKNKKNIPTDSLKTTLLYTGGLTKIRGIKEIVESLAYIHSPVELWLLGKFDNDDYKQKCMDSAEWSKVKYWGFVKHKDVYQYTLSCDIGISLLYPLPNYLTSLPVKAFEYMACEKPIVMSNFEYWKEVFGDVALFCDPMNPKEIAFCIQQMIDNKNGATLLGKEGRKLILEKFSWETESKRLIEMYNNLFSK